MSKRETKEEFIARGGKVFKVLSYEHTLTREYSVRNLFFILNRLNIYRRISRRGKLKPMIIDFETRTFHQQYLGTFNEDTDGS